MSNTPNIILASASPRRKELLGMLYQTLHIVPSGVEEPGPNGQSPAEYAMSLARLKAEDVAKKHANGLVIGADTIVVLGEDVLEKPDGEKGAFAMLRKLSGRTHTVISAVCLINDAKEFTVFSESTRVTFAGLSDNEINRYIATGSPMDKAGAYGIQDDLGALFVSRVDGDYYNVVGFPLHRYYTELKHFAPQYLPEALS